MSSPFGPAATTAMGSLPGEDMHEWVKLVLDALSIPFLPELPARPYSDMVSRAAGMVTQLAMDLQPAGWRLTGGNDPRASLDQRRARSRLLQDLDVLEELADGYTGPLKLQATGPWTLAATVELPRGDKVLADHGARRDLAEALAHGLHEHVDDVRRRIPGADLVVQLDEPALPAVLAGAVPTASGWGKHRSVDGPGAVELLSRVLEAVAPAITVVHCCAARPPIEVFRKAGAGGVAVDLALLTEPAWEQIAMAVEDDVTLYAGVVPTSGPVPHPEKAAERLTRRWHEIGLSNDHLKQVVITPACGLASSPSPADARARLDVLRRTADVVAEAAEA
jgi:methionine synthase II (cobalamin-independent)